jgi:hypothetical protein
MADLTTLYTQAPAIGNAGERVISTDAMPRHPSQRHHPARLMALGQRSDASTKLSDMAR